MQLFGAVNVNTFFNTSCIDESAWYTGECKLLYNSTVTVLSPINPAMTFGAEYELHR